MPGAGWAVAAVVAVAICVIVVASNPDVQKFTKTVTETVVKWVTTFWSWLKRVCKKIVETITTTVVTTVTTPTVTINGTKYKTREATSSVISSLSNNNSYYIALADSSGKMFLSFSTIPYGVAVGLMYENISTTYDSSNRRISVSTYSFNRNNAWKLVENLPSSRTPAIHYPEKHGYSSFYHYHPAFSINLFEYLGYSRREINVKQNTYNEYTPHSFFGYMS